jgi:hypothetical protein
MAFIHHLIIFFLHITLGLSLAFNQHLFNQHLSNQHLSNQHFIVKKLMQLIAYEQTFISMI